MKKDSDPTELVSCGKCGKVNTVPFGLDKFKCYGCGALVLVSREPSAACAAASSTAMYYNDLEVAKTPLNSSVANSSRAIGAANLGSDSLAPEAPKKEAVGFFGKLQQKMDKTMQKVDKTFQNFTTSKPPTETAALPTAPPVVARGPPLPSVNSEDEQLQWALNASLADSRSPANPTPASPPVVMMGRPPNASTNTAIPSGVPSACAGDQMQGAATQVAQKLHGSEERAAAAEIELAKALEREAAAIAQREELKRQLDDNEGIIKGLTEQIDAANVELESKVKHCFALENALAQAQQMADQAADSLVAREGSCEVERQGTVSQLLARIAELESTLLRATHFAPEETPENDETQTPPLISSSGVVDESSACAASVAESEISAKHVEVIPQMLEADVLETPHKTVIVETSASKSVVTPPAQECVGIMENTMPTATGAEAVATTPTAGSKDDNVGDLMFNPPPRLPDEQVDALLPESLDVTKSVDTTPAPEIDSQSVDFAEKDLQDVRKEALDAATHPVDISEKEVHDPNGQLAS